MVRAAALIFLLAPVAAQAEIAAVTRPAPGQVSVAAIGTPLFERTRYEEVEGAVLRAPMKIGLFGTIDAGTTLYRIKSKAAFKACAAKSGHCGLDDDGDGKFDRWADDDVSMALKLKVPVPYDAVKVPARGADAFKQVVTYLGSAGGVLRMSYREFVNDMARPAFTEDYSFEIGASFPAPVAFRDVRMTVLGLGADGLRYRVESTGADVPVTR